MSRPVCRCHCEARWTNVTALTDASGNVIERYGYDPYGMRTVLDANWTADADGESDVGFVHGHQGLRFDPATGLYDSRLRPYDPALGRFTSQDPLGYIDGANRYQAYGGGPGNHVDPLGLSYGDIAGFAPALGDFGPLAPSDQTLVAPANVPEGEGETVLVGYGRGRNGPTAMAHSSDEVSPFVFIQTASGIMVWIWTEDGRMVPTDGLTYHSEEQAIEHLPQSLAYLKEQSEADEALAWIEMRTTGLEILLHALPGGATMDHLHQREWGEAGKSALIDATLLGLGAALVSLGRAGRALGSSDELAEGLARGFCFVAGTPVREGDGELTAIEDVRVGDRVATDGGQSNNGSADVDPYATAVNPDTWRLLTIRAEQEWEDGTIDIFEIQTLQPPQWIEANGAVQGAYVDLPLDLVEMGAPEDLQGQVLAIEAVPEIADGPGRVVLTTVSHLNNFVFDLTVRNAQGDLETLGVTGWHKFYDEAEGWQSASELDLGDTLRGLDGQPMTVVSLQRDEGIHRVYNLTVEADHVYYVGELSTLTHNNGCAAKYPLDIQGGVPRSALFPSEGAARATARTAIGRNPVTVGPNKLRSINGRWQYRAKPVDTLRNHVHLERLDPVTGQVLENWHFYWPVGKGR